jgi:hypothetical protein
VLRDAGATTVMAAARRHAMMRWLDKQRVNVSDSG